MSDVEPRAAGLATGTAAAERPGLGRGLKWAILAAVVIGALAVLYVIAASLAKPGGGGGFHALATGPMAKLQDAPEGLSYPATLFVDADGRALHLSDFRGQAVVLNLWATWCAPCKREMPTLAALQRAYAGRPLKVVAISMDQAAQTDQAKAFIAAHPPLGFYQDAKYAFLTDLKPHLQGFPTTVLFDRNGVERAIMAGDPCPDDQAQACAGWSSPEAHKVMDKLLGM